ncbi:hypothetical protein C5E44_04605 [Nocardia nova]|nr:hypothetical protein C5E44_04605 [Nocardia nova]
MSTTAELAIANGTATIAAVRCHHRAPGQPTTISAIAATATPTQIHSRTGAGSEARPSLFITVRAAKAATTPRARQIGTRISHHRRPQRTTATTSRTAATISMVSGSQPCSSETP